MSLKGFHIFFLIVAVLFCLGFTAWAYLSTSEIALGMRTTAAVTGFMGFFLLIYTTWFIRKKASTIIVY
jgi:hypothetical protein